MPPSAHRSRTAVAPLERLKILMQVQGNVKVYTGVWQGLKHMMATEGARGMMKGNLANCIRIVPNSAMKFLAYEQLSRRAAPHRGPRAEALIALSSVHIRGLCGLNTIGAPPYRRISHYMIDNGGDGQMTPGLRLAAGAGAGIVAMSATYPLDMVRGRLTIQEGRRPGSGGYRGISHAATSIVKQVRRSLNGESSLLFLNSAPRAALSRPALQSILVSSRPEFNT